MHCWVAREKLGIEHAFTFEFDYDFELANIHFCFKYMN